MPIVSATRAPCAISSASRNDIPLIDSPPFDWSIVRGIALMHRPSRSQNTSIENSSPRQSSCTIDSTGVWLEEERELGRVGGPVDVTRAEPFADLDEQGVARVGRAPRPGASVRGLGMPCSSKNTCATYLSAIVAHTSIGGASRRAGSSSVALAREDALVDVGDGDDELDVVLGDERGKRGDIAGVATRGTSAM